MNDYYCEQVLSGKTPVEVVAETDLVLAFYHTRPAWNTHIVIIPKQHIRVLTDVKDRLLLVEILEVAQSLIRNLELNESNYKLITNGGSYQSNQHLHFHLVSGLPRDASSLTQKGELQV